MKDFDTLIFQGYKTKEEKSAILNAELQRLDYSIDRANDYITTILPQVLTGLKKDRSKARAFCRKTKALWQHLGLWDELITELTKHYEGDRKDYSNNTHNPA